MKLDKIGFATLISYISHVTSFELTETEVDKLDCMIDVKMPQPDVAYPSVSDINYLMSLMAEGKQMIEAIKMHRKLTGWGLKESKDLVEKYWVSKPATDGATLGEILATATK